MHRARNYAYDTNAHKRKQRDKEAKKNYKLGNISKDEYKRRKQTNAVREFNENVAVNQRLSKVRPIKGAKISSIYNSYKKTALKEIPDYRLRKGAKIAGKVLLQVGLLGLGAYSSQVSTAAFANSRKIVSDVNDLIFKGVDFTPEAMAGVKEAVRSYDRLGRSASSLAKSANVTAMMYPAMANASKRASKNASGYNSTVPIKKRKKHK